MYVSCRKSQKTTKTLLCTVVFLLITCRTATETYWLFFSWSAGLLSLISNAISLGLLFTLPFWFYKTCSIKKLRELLMPLYLLLLIIVLKHIVLIAEYGGLGFLSPSFYSSYPNFPEGFYIMGLQRWLTIGSLIMWIVYEIDSKAILNKCLKVSAIAFLIPIILMIVCRPDLIGLRLVLVDNVFFGGGFWNIGVRGFLAFGWLWILMYFDKSQSNRKLFLAAAIISVVSGCFGVSRAIIVSVSMAILFYILFNIKSTRPIKVILTVAICVFAVYLFFGNTFIDAFIDRFKNLNDVSSLEEESRFLIWKSYLSNISDYLFFGAPIGSYFRYAIPPKFCSPHSSPMLWLVQYGVFALIAYLSLLWKIVRNSKLLNKDISHNILLWLITYISITFINESGYFTTETYIGLALVFSTINIYLSEQKENREEQRIQVR